MLGWLSQWLNTCARENILTPLQADSAERSLGTLSFALGSCERIANTPLPFAYSVILHRSVYLYCALLPFGLVDSIGLMTPLIVSFVSYTFFALEALSDEIENPTPSWPVPTPACVKCGVRCRHLHHNPTRTS